MTDQATLERLETIRAELAFCYEDLAPLMTYRTRIAEALKLVDTWIDELTPTPCRGVRHADYTPCPSEAVPGGLYCQRHLGGQKGAKKRLTARKTV